MDQEELQKNTVADGYSSLPADAEQFVTVPETEGLLDYGMEIGRASCRERV